MLKSTMQKCSLIDSKTITLKEIDKKIESTKTNSYRNMETDFPSTIVFKNESQSN